MFKYNCKKYENLYMKRLYFRMTDSYNPDVINEIQVAVYPFHTGMRVLTTDGYLFFDDIHCKNFKEVLKEVKRLSMIYKRV